MNFILYGYPDKKGLGPRKAIAGDGITTSEDAFEKMEMAQRQGIRPAGFLRLELCRVDDPQEIHEFISDETDEVIKGGHKKLLSEQAAARAAEAALREKSKFTNATERLFQQAVQKRNEAVGKVAAQRNLLDAGTLPEKDKPAILAKIEKLQPDADAAIAAFEIVLAARNIIKNPKSKPEDVEKALIDLKLKPAPAATN